MQRTGNRLARLVAALVVLVAIGLPVVPVWAAGPPIISFAAVWKNHFVSDSLSFPDPLDAPPGTDQLFASLTVEEPFGSVPENITSVTVQVPLGLGTFQIPLERKDFDHDSYLINLTKAGVPGFPIGTYTFSVTDSAAHTVMAVRTIGAFGALAPTSAIPTVSGSTSQTTGATVGAEVAEVVLELDPIAVPQPTVTFNRVSGATSYRVLIRTLGGFAILSHVIKDSTCGVTSCTLTLPKHLLGVGHRYRLHVNALDDPTNSADLSQSTARSQRETDLLVEGPIVQLRILGDAAAGHTITIQARVRNGVSTQNVLADAALRVPGFGNFPLIQSMLVSVPNGLDSGFVTVFSHTFATTEPAGLYVFRLRLVDPNTSIEIADVYQPFQR